MKMNERSPMAEQTTERPLYEAPEIRVMTELEVLSAFQVTAAGTGTWWAM